MKTVRKLAVVAYPVLSDDDREWTAGVRPRNDPLASRSPAHVTLVFPTEVVEEPLCLPLIPPISLMPPAASIRDAVHRRAAPSRLCPDSAAAQSEAWVRLSTAINVSASRCSSRRTLTGSLEDAVRRSRRRGPGIHVESSRSPARHTRFAMASGAQ